MTARGRPDLSLVVLGERSQHALELIEAFKPDPGNRCGPPTYVARRPRRWMRYPPGQQQDEDNDDDGCERVTSHVFS